MLRRLLLRPTKTNTSLLACLFGNVHVCAAELVTSLPIAGEELARALTEDQGKPYHSEALPEVDFCCTWLSQCVRTNQMAGNIGYSD